MSSRPCANAPGRPIGSRTAAAARPPNTPTRTPDRQQPWRPSKSARPPASAAAATPEPSAPPRARPSCPRLLRPRRSPTGGRLQVVPPPPPGPAPTRRSRVGLAADRPTSQLLRLGRRSAVRDAARQPPPVATSMHVRRRARPPYRVATPRPRQSERSGPQRARFGRMPSQPARSLRSTAQPRPEHLPGSTPTDEHPTDTAPRPPTRPGRASRAAVSAVRPHGEVHGSPARRARRSSALPTPHLRSASPCQDAHPPTPDGPTPAEASVPVPPPDARLATGSRTDRCCARSASTSPRTPPRTPRAR